MCEAMLWRRSHLASARDQGLVDLGLRRRLSSCSCAGMRCSTSVALATKHKKCSTQHGNKYRVSPCDPMCWAPCHELYQQVRERPPWASRRDVMRMTAKQWKEGKTATSPHGSSCVDREIYEVSPNSAVKVRGTTACSLALHHLFPTSSGVFGHTRCWCLLP